METPGIQISILKTQSYLSTVSSLPFVTTKAKPRVKQHLIDKPSSPLFHICYTSKEENTRQVGTGTLHLLLQHLVNRDYEQ